jgi:DNA-binding LacI/PurR family transcriptional regulator
VLPKLLNPNYAMIFTGAYECARRLGYSMSMFPWRSVTENEDKVNPALLLAERRLDGVIICVEYLPPEHHERLKQSLQGMEEGNIDRFLEYMDKVMGATDFREGADGANAKKEITVDDINRV